MSQWTSIEITANNLKVLENSSVERKILWLKELQHYFDQEFKDEGDFEEINAYKKLSFPFDLLGSEGPVKNVVYSRSCDLLLLEGKLRDTEVTSVALRLQRIFVLLNKIGMTNITINAQDNNMKLSIINSSL